VHTQLLIQIITKAYLCVLTEWFKFMIKCLHKKQAQTNLNKPYKLRTYTSSMYCASDSLLPGQPCRWWSAKKQVFMN